MPENNNIEIRSEDVREILGSPPNWIIRSTISIISVVIIILLIGSYFYKYPDFINGRVTIVSSNPPIPIIAKANGKLERLLVSDSQFIIKGHVIGIVENPADYYDIIKLRFLLDSIGLFFEHSGKLVLLNLPDTLEMGQNQSLYSAFTSQLSEVKNFYQFDYLGQQAESISKQVVDYERHTLHLKDQTRVQKDDLELSMKQLKRDSALHSKGVMSEMLFEQAQASYLKQQYNYKNSISNLSNTQIKINQLKQQVLEINTQKAQQEKKLLTNLKESYNNLEAQLDIWEQTYLLTAPIEGEVTFNDIWSENQHVQVGKTVFTVVPKLEQKIIGKLVFPVEGSGKVEVGQEVNIKLDNFPYMEYGLLESTVFSISKVPVLSPEGGYYTAELKLTNGLVTNYHKELPFIQEMQGTAEVITKDRRLIERLVQPMIAIFKKNVR